MTASTDLTILRFVSGSDLPDDLLARYRDALNMLLDGPLPRLPGWVHRAPILLTLFQPLSAKSPEDVRVLYAIRIAAFVSETHPDTVKRFVNFKSRGNGLLSLIGLLTIEGLAFPLRAARLFRIKAEG